jgi:UDP-N-acetylmuramate dehydrogenase
MEKHRLAALISGAIKGRVRVDVPMASLTTFRVGGPADVLVEPLGTEDLLRLADLLGCWNVKVEVVGRGSNILVADRGIRGVVVRVGQGMGRIRFEGRSIVEVESGCSLNRLVRETVRRGLGGMERLMGIPGSLGGAVRMNAGAFGQEVGDLLEEAFLLRLGPEGCDGVYVKRAVDLKMRYRDCDLERGEMFVKFRFRFIESEREELVRSMKWAMAERRRKQPLDWPSAGSVFKNPPGISAGELIDRCGLKGRRVGDVMVSEKHANFIINLGKATASQARYLMEMVKEEVLERSGVLLEEEVRLVGDWGDAD